MIFANNFYLLFFIFSNLFCNSPKPEVQQTKENVKTELEATPILTGADQTDKYLSLLKGLRVGLLVNQTSIVGSQHLVDVLKEKGINVTTIFAPEHGFRGDADAGQELTNSVDKETGISVISIYGKKKGPDQADLANVDVVVFDVQDVGARFYTYLSTLKYLMEACAEFKKPLMILDRPNTNGHYIDGPVLEMENTSFVGIIPIPIVHGMTLGELGLMMNNEGMLKDKLKCELKVVPCGNYDHQKSYILPVKPSPNLPNQISIMLYPSLCLFEGTNFSVGRGTDKQFQVYGSPLANKGDFYFTPQPKPGAMTPFLQGKKCRGYDLSNESVEKIKSEKKINLGYFIQAYKDYPDKPNFFLKNNFIDLLMGTKKFQQQVKSGMSEVEIRASWKEGIDKFKIARKKYLIYPD